MKKLAFAFVAALAVSACGTATSADPASKAAPDQPTAPTPPKSTGQMFSDRLDQALAGSWRSDANKARDKYRHPKETLGFFGLKGGQTVIEMLPGGGWYTEILAPALKGQGKLVVAIVAPDTAVNDGTKKYLTRTNEELRAKLKADPEHFGEVEVREFATKGGSLGPDNSADVVVTFRNVHNFLMWDADQAYFQSMFKVLKPGGVLGVTDHRAAPGSDIAKIKETGYIPEDYVIQLATQAGFKLDGRSEINANPKDTKDYEGGVWTLPPSLSQKDKDKDKYLAIGESDRMTLRFVKPAAAAK